MANSTVPTPKLKVAIIGGGPAGLAAAIEIAKRPFIDWKLYEKKSEISEISNGLSIQRNTWRMLELLGAAHHLTTDDFFRPADGHNTQHRNGLTGELINTSFPPKEKNKLPHQAACRAHRARLQQALLKEVDQSRVRVGRRLVSVERLQSGRLRLTFGEGITDEVDLLVGADGIRSVVRQFAFPSHSVSYTGSTAYRTLVRTSDALKINGMPEAVIFWHGPGGKWVYTCPLGGNDFEVTAKIREPLSDERASWGRDASVQHFVDGFSDMCPPVKQLLEKVTYVQQFDFFAGTRLNTVIEGGSVALIGDASHPLSGAFGAGAAFALEDAYALGVAIEWGFNTGRTLEESLTLFDSVRSPHYDALYGVLDEYAAADKIISEQRLSDDEQIAAHIESVWHSKHNWMYYYEVDRVLGEAIRQAESQNPGATVQARL
ncbi:Salicylate hydroxylase [Pleurostoma richardsiae]|uniref:Salicylate hydroxylase n=1 Tax=Pleurostoma richardsiae TaxID=41990 RepID=A0AA38RJJ8_9PEZI|nr:Salicylate hydroxylase [Pleurostoma richardsiae]